MDKELIYMPTFRYRQQEGLLLSSFDFGENIYPMIEIVKEHDRKNNKKSFQEIHTSFIDSIKAKYVFVDLPNYINPTGAVKREVVEFVFKVINKLETKCEYINLLSTRNHKIIPVISSYLAKTGENDTIVRQEELLRPNYKKIAFRININSFHEDYPQVVKIIQPQDYLIIDLDKQSAFKTPPLKPIVEEIKKFNICTKILLRSAINDIENVKLDHGQPILEADNSQIDTDIMKTFGVNATGDYAGIKKDNMTSGGSISPGFVYFDATENQFYGYKASIKKSLSEFENTIVPHVLASGATGRMLAANPSFLTEENWGYKTLLRINSEQESGKSQAKFKRISMEHYLFCVKTLIENHEIFQTNI
ncbi:beta family protein [Chryseobacterium arthrosphaerae]|uniref:Uncharacterized protein n=1 Tax=Chryseobacterium arthrosphaerae TaxID=651561 RepID=A0A1B8ZIC4_9FLAO|nr:hypothetical protein [Chryseobacterium arthrosphaerae]OCA71352.1 hypothetical protein BBI00_16660 [Chryseobacterium arthrosphaerae]